MQTFLDEQANKQPSWRERRRLNKEAKKLAKAEEKAAAQAAKEAQQQQAASTTTATTGVATPAKLASFYEQAIEWTHGADKVVNLVLGYMLAIASVLGFMDVLSNGQVLSTVPWAFYAWLAIMGLGVDFQILLVIGRIPELIKTIEHGGIRWLFIVFNAGFLGFLAYMSIVIGAVFTEHRDMPEASTSTISAAMNILHIDSTNFVFQRAALATFLLVLMAIDRTLERWRMQQQRISAAPVQVQATPAQEPVQQAAPIQTSDLEKILQTVVTLNQQNLQAMQAQVSQISVSVVEETMNRLTASVSLPAGAQKLLASGQGEQEGEQGEQKQQPSGDTEPLHVVNSDVRGEQNYAFSKSYGPAITALLKDEPGLTDREIADRVGCGVGTANKWKQRLQPTA